MTGCDAAVMIQREGPEALGAISDLVALCSEVPRWSTETWRTYLEPSSDEVVRRVLLGTRDRQSRLLGLVAFSVLGGTTELEFLLVHHGCRRLGWGFLLAHRWLRWASSMGATQALLEVRQSNVAGRTLYSKMGFREQGRRGQYYRDPVEDAVLMEKNSLVEL